MQYKYLSASGPSLKRCVVLGYRAESLDEWTPEAHESWVLRRDGEQLSLLSGSTAHLTGLWQSPTGKLFAAGTVLYTNTSTDPMVAAWDAVPLPGHYDGVFGVSDDLVFAWGGTRDMSSLARFDGRNWTPIEAPGEIVAMHGIAPDLVFAVGMNGLVARWDGSRFQVMSSGTAGMLNSVFVASASEVYATGPGKRLMEGSIYGFAERLVLPFSGYGVVKWRDEVFVSGGVSGLHRVNDDTLENVEDVRYAKRLYADDELILVDDSSLIGTADMTNWDFAGLLPFEDLLANRPPMW